MKKYNKNIFQNIPVNDSLEDELEKDENNNNSYINNIYSLLKYTKSSKDIKLPNTYMENEYGVLFREYSIIEKMKKNIFDEISIII